MTLAQAAVAAIAVAVAVVLMVGNSAAMKKLTNEVVHEARGAHVSTVVFLHGLGDDGRGWCSEWASRRLEGVRIVCPNASSHAVTANGGHRMSSWFDMRGFSSKVLLDEKLDPCEGIEESVALVHNTLEREVALLGGKSNRVVLGGFSQGGALAIQAGYRFGHTLGGIVSCSGWAVAWSKFAVNEANRDTPAQLHHGKYDEVIPLVCSDALVTKLTEAKVKHERFLSNQEHGFDDWARVSKFVQDVNK